MGRQSTARKWDGVRQLMRDAWCGPLLGEASFPLAASVSRPVKNILEYPFFLVERFLDKKRVVEDVELLSLREASRRPQQDGGDHNGKTPSRGKASGHPRASTS